MKGGYNGNSYAAENKSQDGSTAKLDFDFSKSSNVMTEIGAGGLISSVSIPSGQSVIVRHLMPFDDSQGWSAEWGVSGSFDLSENASK